MPTIPPYIGTRRMGKRQDRKGLGSRGHRAARRGNTPPATRGGLGGVPHPRKPYGAMVISVEIRAADQRLLDLLLEVRRRQARLDREVERMVREAEATPPRTPSGSRRSSCATRPTGWYTRPGGRWPSTAARLSESERRTVEQALNDAREALKADDIERIRRAQESLTRLAPMLAEAMRRESPGGAGGGPTTPGAGRESPGAGDVVDAEFEDVDDRRAG